MIDKRHTGAGFATQCATELGIVAETPEQKIQAKILDLVLQEMAEREVELNAQVQTFINDLETRWIPEIERLSAGLTTDKMITDLTNKWKGQTNYIALKTELAIEYKDTPVLVSSESVIADGG